MARLGLIDAARADRIADLAWPRIVTGLARMSKATADVAMVGSALGASAIAGVGYAVPFWTLAFMLGGGVAGATISMVSQRYGAEAYDSISVVVKVSAALAAVITLPLVVLFWTSPTWVLGWIGAEGQALTYGAEYLKVCSLAMPFAALGLVGSRTLIGADDAWSPMVIRAGGAVVNIGLNAVLIFVFDMGVVGAALGTVIGNAFGTAAFAWGLWRGRLPGIGELPVRVRGSSPHWDGDVLRRMVRIGTPLALRRVARNGGQFPLLGIVGMFGPQVLAAFVIALRVRALMNTPGWGFGLASSSLVGQSLGATHEEAADGFAHDSLRFTVTVYALVGSVVFVLAPYISPLFSAETALQPTTTAFIRATCVSILLWGLMNGAMGPLRAGGDTLWPFGAQMIGLFAFALPVAYVGATTSLGLWALYAAIVLETGVPALLIYARFRMDVWKQVDPVGAAA